MEHDNVNDSARASGSGTDESARVKLVDQFLQSARSLDKDGSKTISQADGKAAEVTGTATKWFSGALETVLSYKDMLDPSSSSEPEKSPVKVDVKSLIDRQKESPKVLSHLYRSRETTSQLMDNFDSIDADDDRFLKPSEVVKAHKAGTVSRSAIGFLSKEFDSIENASNDEWGSENNGITRDDIKAVEFKRESSPENIFFDGLADHIAGKPALIDELIENRFDQLDLDSDDSLSRLEMNFATEDPLSRLDSTEKKLVNLLLEHDDVFEFKNGFTEDDTAPLLSKADLKQFASVVEGRTFDEEDLLEQYRNSDIYASRQKTSYDWGTGAGLLAGASAGAAVGFFTAGPVGLVPGVPLGGVTGGIAGSIGGHYGGGAALDRMFHRDYARVRLPALVSFRDDYRELRQKK